MENIASLLKSVGIVAVGIGTLIGIGYITTSEKDLAELANPTAKPKPKQKARQQVPIDDVEEEQDGLDSFSGGQEKQRVLDKAAIQKAPKLMNDPFEAPTGFFWYFNQFFGCGVLVPDDWLVTEHQPHLTFAVVPKRTKETCFTSTCFPRQKPEFVEYFVEQMTEKLKEHNILQDWTKREIGKVFESYSLVYETKDDHVICSAQIIHNKQTGTVYHVAFESPSSEFAGVFESYGQTMTSSVVLMPGL